jgi:1-deoxy-D-xylulose-5-phosphate reductoisomerase
MTIVNAPRTIAILGSTGSIGKSSLDVIASFPDRFRVTYLTAMRNIDLLREQINRFHPRGVVVADERLAEQLRHQIDGVTEVLAGPEGLMEVVGRPDVDTVISALVGFAGLRPTLRAIECGKQIALANKETLVVGGELVVSAARRKNIRLLPVDSEHSAIFQCLQGEDPRSIERIILTASGGPFLHLPQEEFSSITVDRALSHPTWKMGRKITIDSATLMNKGLEVIEAYWLFGVTPKQIDVVVHPQSIVHSFVEFTDGSTKAQLGFPDMKLPIQYALTYPERPTSGFRRIDFGEISQLTFLPPDRKKFPCLAAAFRALEMGGTSSAVLNAANEVAVELFLDGQIPFTAIPTLIEKALDDHAPLGTYSLSDLEELDADTRRRTRHDSHSFTSTRHAT